MTDHRQCQAALTQVRQLRNPMIAYVFPGQGSQKLGMGAGLFERFPRLTAAASEILGYSIAKMCLEDPDQNLNCTQYTQPAIYVVSCLDYLNWISIKERRPDFVAGHSIGEYASLFAAGAFNFTAGLRLVKERGALMSQARGGAMAAVIGLDLMAVSLLLNQSNLNVEIAIDNSPNQFVISGAREQIEQAESVFIRSGAEMYVSLAVSGAFHSHLMSAAQQEFQKTLDRFSFSELAMPVIANVDGRPYRNGEIAAKLGPQITQRVRWTETVEFLIESGVSEFEEMGGSQVLTKLIRQTRDAVAKRAVHVPTYLGDAA